MKRKREGRKRKTACETVSESSSLCKAMKRDACGTNPEDTVQCTPGKRRNEESEKKKSIV